MHKIWENWPEAPRVGAPGDKILHLSPSLWGGGGGGGVGRVLLTRVPRHKLY